MSIQKVKKYFKEYNLENRILEFDKSSATVELAANILGCLPERIAKSLTFMVNNDPVMIVTSGTVKIDNHKYKEKFNTKAKMLSMEEVEEYIGHQVGGVCPFGINEGVKVYLDLSLKEFETVYPACGSSNSAIELTIEELEKYSNYIEWIDVCRKV